MRKFNFIILLLLVAFLIGCGTAHENDKPSIGLVNAVEIDVASKIPGRIKELYVREGDVVELNQKLLAIESHELEAKVDQVMAINSAAKAKLRMAENGAREEQIRAAKRQMEAAQHQVDITKKMYERLKNLYEQKAVPRAKFEEAEFRYNVSVEQFEMARANYDAYKKGARDEQIDALRALVRQAEGALDEVESYHSETEQFAPLAGEISKIVLHPGELAATGFPILTIVDMNDLWVSFTMREDRLQKVHKGDKIKVEIPALNQTVEMEVFNIAAMGDFATWRATSDNNGFDLKTFEVKARPLQPVAGLRPGMTARWQ